jgi:hypothetical protein
VRLVGAPRGRGRGACMCACVARRAAAIRSLILLVLAPAEARPPGGGENTGSGDTISAGTLAEGQIAAPVRYEFIRLGQLDDAALLAAAEQGKHGHSIRSIESASRSRRPTASPMNAWSRSAFPKCGAPTSVRRQRSAEEITWAVRARPLTGRQAWRSAPS